MSDNIGKYKSEEHINYITINEGIYNGVSYRINSAKVEEVDGKNILIFDYDVKGLDIGKDEEFEQYLGEFLTNALEWAKSVDNIGNRNDI